MASEQKFEIEWRNDQPTPGSFIETTRDKKEIVDRFYWMRESRLNGLHWRPAAPSIIPTQEHPAISRDDDGHWLVVKTDPALQVSTVWRVHELGKELFVPLVRERRPTGRRAANGQTICVLRPKPMFMGYGFIRRQGLGDTAKFLDVRGVSDFMRDENGDAATLPHEAIVAIFAKQHSEHQKFVQSKGGRVSKFKRGDMVRVDEGSVYSGLVAQIEKIDAKGRVQVLLGMIRHTLPSDMVVAA